MSDIIAIIELIKGTPTIFTLTLTVISIAVMLILRARDTNIHEVTSISKAQNEQLMALMNQNEQLLESVATLQVQVQTLHHQMNEEADEHRKKLEQTYKVVDEMRTRISELEDLVRVYQKRQDHICIVEHCHNRKK